MTRGKRAPIFFAADNLHRKRPIPRSDKATPSGAVEGADIVPMELPEAIYLLPYTASAYRSLLPQKSIKFIEVLKILKMITGLIISEYRETTSTERPLPEGISQPKVTALFSSFSSKPLYIVFGYFAILIFCGSCGKIQIVPFRAGIKNCLVGTDI